MTYEIRYQSEAEKIIHKWRRSNPLLFKKLQDIFHELIEHPRSGIGHPEPLKGGGGTIYSRRISAHDRIVYKINDDEVWVLVLQVGGHYTDK